MKREIFHDRVLLILSGFFLGFVITNTVAGDYWHAAFDLAFAGACYGMAVWKPAGWRSRE